MASIIWTDIAIDDLKAIHDYISRDSPRYADRYTEKLIARVDQLVEAPLSGRVVPEFGSTDIRELIEGSYRIVYKMLNDKIAIARIHHSARLLQQI
ncbi:MAG: type II toxin-antitoxin system RelE/ParE family toxin [Cytophagales bacterium]|nr:type II toxin-antitoxin system RelE/ParE family toxin [Cytophagales bacterium]